MYSPQRQYAFVRPPELDGDSQVHPVVIVGGGAVGLTLWLALARRGIPTVVLEDSDSVCHGSRALGMARRTVDIWECLGIGEKVSAEAIAWYGGRSFYRDAMVLEYTIPHDRRLRYPPILNIQQSLVEQYLVDEILLTGSAQIRWRSQFKSLAQKDGFIEATVDTPDGPYLLRTQYLVACDGAKSTVRDLCNLKMEGTFYTGRYIIVDIRLKSSTKPGRRAWFDPPSNPGSTVLMHAQPHDVWRIDFQIADGVSVEDAMQPDALTAQIRRHLVYIGEREPFEVMWVSSYRAHSRTLESYRCGNVFLCGDAAHLLPIFGIRGLNSGVEDAFNLAWKLDLVLQNRAHPGLLDSYSAERVPVARENMRLANRAADFMTPPSRGQRVMRDAILSLAVHMPEVSALINPKQATLIPLSGSPLNSYPERSNKIGAGPIPGDVLPNVVLAGAAATTSLYQHLGHNFSLVVCGSPELQPSVDQLVSRLSAAWPINSVFTADLRASGDRSLHRWDAVRELLQVTDPTIYLVRPDHHIAARWTTFEPAEIEHAIAIATARE